MQLAPGHQDGAPPQPPAGLHRAFVEAARPHPQASAQREHQRRRARLRELAQRLRLGLVPQEIRFEPGVAHHPGVRRPVGLRRRQQRRHRQQVELLRVHGFEARVSRRGQAQLAAQRRLRAHQQAGAQACHAHEARLPQPGASGQLLRRVQIGPQRRIAARRYGQRRGRAEHPGLAQQASYQRAGVRELVAQQQLRAFGQRQQGLDLGRQALRRQGGLQHRARGGPGRLARALRGLGAVAHGVEQQPRLRAGAGVVRLGGHAHMVPALLQGLSDRKQREPIAEAALAHD